MPPKNLKALGWRIGLTLLLLALLLIFAAGRPRTAGAQSGGDPLVLAFYYLWYDDATWTSDQLSDLPAQTYASSDRAAMGRHIEQARGAGIDALVAAWFGPGGGNPTEANVAALLEEAAARGARAAILFETNSPFLGGQGDVTAALQHLLSVHAQQPAYLRVDGRPVIFFWRTQMYSVEQWRTIRAQADPNNSAIWIADGTDTSYLAVFDGHHLYSNTWNPPANLEAVNARYAAQVAQARDSYGQRFWVATAMPGYNDVKARHGNGFAQDREGGGYYGRAWAAAVASNPNWVVITSFNEWPEGSYIEPSQAYGDAYLGITAQWSAQFKAGGGAPAGDFVAAAVAPAAPSEPTPDLTPSGPTAYVETQLLYARSGPGTNFSVVQELSQGDALAVTGRSDTPTPWWQVDVGGQPAWVSGDFVRTAGAVDGTPLLALGELGAAVAVSTPQAVPLLQQMRAPAPADFAPDEAPVVFLKTLGPILSPRP